MSKTIQEQITELESRCARYEELHKLFEKAVKNEFGVDAKKIHSMLEKSSQDVLNFGKAIASYYGLKTPEDYDNFIDLFCHEMMLDIYVNGAPTEAEDTEQTKGVEDTVSSEA